jgi:Ni,Fe-hydrogenase I large subunit
MASSSQGNDALCESHAKKLQKDLEVAASASRGGTTAVRNVHLIYVHVHGHIDHYYHFLHDALLTFFPLYTAFADDEGNPTISRVMLWGRQSFGSFKPIFEAVSSQR